MASSTLFPFKPAPKNTTHKWKIALLRDSQTFCYNIPAYQQEATDRRFYYPMRVFHFTCQDPLAPIEDIIVARYRNRVKCKHSEENDEFFCIMAAPREGVVNKFKQNFKSIHNGTFRPLLASMDDWRQRFGFVAACHKSHETQQALEILADLHAIVPVPEYIMEICHNLMMAPKFVETEAILGFPKDMFDAPYFAFSRATLYFGGGNYRTFFEDEAIIRDVIPPLHQAILDNDEAAIKSIIQADPNTVNLKDPWGVTAYDIAQYATSIETWYLFLEAKYKTGPISMGDRLTLHNAAISYLNSDNTKTEKQIAADQAKMQRYRYLIKQPIQKRNNLHLACINGDIEAVKAYIAADKNRLEEQDPRGFTPALLAAANGHATLLRWLLQQGASREKVVFKHPFHGLIQYRLIDNAATGEVMNVLLQYRIDPAEFNNNRLIHAILNNQISIAKFLIYYLQNLPHYKGLNAVNLALHLTPQYGTEMLRMILMAHDALVQSGPYDSNIPTAVAALLEQHNKRQEAKAKKKLLCAKWLSESIVGNHIVTWFHSENLFFKSVIKSVAEINSEEREMLFELFDSNFGMVNPQDNKREYFEEQLAYNRDKPGYINLFYLGNRIIAFFEFEIIADKHHQIGEFILFHAKLGANDPQFSSHGWLAIGFRAMTAINAHNKRIFVYAEAVPPGLGLCGMLPPQVEFNPKQALPEDFMQQVVRLTESELKGKKIYTKVKTQVRHIDSDNIVLDYFKTMTGGSDEIAMAACYEVTPFAIIKYLEKIAPNGIGTVELKEFQAHWEEFQGIRFTPVLSARL